MFLQNHVLSISPQVSSKMPHWKCYYTPVIFARKIHCNHAWMSILIFLYLVPHYHIKSMHFDLFWMKAIGGVEEVQKFEQLEKKGFSFVSLNSESFHIFQMVARFSHNSYLSHVTYHLHQSPHRKVGVLFPKFSKVHVQGSFFNIL